MLVAHERFILLLLVAAGLNRSFDSEEQRHDYCIDLIDLRCLLLNVERCCLSKTNIHNAREVAMIHQ